MCGAAATTWSVIWEGAGGGGRWGGGERGGRPHVGVGLCGAGDAEEAGEVVVAVAARLEHEQALRGDGGGDAAVPGGVGGLHPRLVLAEGLPVRARALDGEIE